MISEPTDLLNRLGSYFFFDGGDGIIHLVDDIDDDIAQKLQEADLDPQEMLWLKANAENELAVKNIGRTCKPNPDHIHRLRNQLGLGWGPTAPTLREVTDGETDTNIALEHGILKKAFFDVQGKASIDNTGETGIVALRAAHNIDIMNNRGIVWAEGKNIDAMNLKASSTTHLSGKNIIAQEIESGATVTIHATGNVKLSGVEEGATVHVITKGRVTSDFVDPGAIITVNKHPHHTEAKKTGPTLGV